MTMVTSITNDVQIECGRLWSGIDVAATLKSFADPAWVAPVEPIEYLRRMGREAFYQGLEPQASWPDTMRRTWIRLYRSAVGAIADAETSVYLVGQGLEGEL